MRRILPVLFSCVLLVVPSFGAGHGGGGGHSGGGGGMRGGGGGGMRSGGGGFRAVGGYRGGGYRGGGYRGGFRGNYGGYRSRFGYGGFYPGYYGYYNPFLWDTGFGWDYGDSGYGSPDYGYPDSGYPQSGGYPSYAAPNPQVLVISNQTPPQPVIVQPPPPPAAWNAGPSAQSKKYEDTLFLLAMRDGTIRAVLAYWVDGATVHYVTMDHDQKQTPLSSLDRSLSERLNRERNVTFSLPG
jgi:hypothetical protein